MQIANAGRGRSTPSQNPQAFTAEQREVKNYVALTHPYQAWKSCSDSDIVENRWTDGWRHSKYTQCFSFYHGDNYLMLMWIFMVYNKQSITRGYNKQFTATVTWSDALYDVLFLYPWNILEARNVILWLGNIYVLHHVTVIMFLFYKKVLYIFLISPWKHLL